jgi:hypothetical protein
LIEVVATQRYLNGLLLTGALAGNASAGQLVRVQGTLSAAGNSLEVANSRLQNPAAGALPQGEIEIEGLVTSITSASRFMLGNTAVDTSGSSFSPASAQISVGARVEVYGAWQAGVLKASKVELESEQSLHEVEIGARIEQFVSLANFVVRGQRCDATHATISNGTAADLRVGVKVEVKGTKAGGDVLLVTTLEIDR